MRQFMNRCSAVARPQGKRMSNQFEKSAVPEELLVSVVIPTYGRPECLPQLLAQLLTQDAPGINYEIIVVDDGSPEPISSFVEVASRQAEVPVRCLRKENGGPASARNFGAKAACGK